MDEVRERELRREQERLDALYARLDQLIAQSRAALAEVRRTVSSDPSSRTTRDALDTFHSERLAALSSAEERLCFGRLDLTSGATHHVGRLGLSEGGEQLLVDWRAPAAEPFYQATAARPLGVSRRRHLGTRDRRVLSVEDDVLDLEHFDPSASVSGDGALLSALNAARTGRMADIVSTIQAEQDRIIRSPLDGILVVQGGPGTGKTAVALHRAAYLLYTHRERLARSGVLLVGPNRAFLRYVENVLPSLGETGVVMATPAELYPGVRATASDSPRVAALKGDLRMVGALRRAVEALTDVPSRPLRLECGGSRLSLSPAAVRTARSRARRSRTYSAGRATFAREVLDVLVLSLAEARSWDPVERRSELLEDLHSSLSVRQAVNRLWPPHTPESFLRSLFASPDLLARTGLSELEQLLLWRPRSGQWTPADVPLLDEVAELLGEEVAPRSVSRADEDELAYARESASMVDFRLPGVEAEGLLERYAGSGPLLSVAERAGADRSWAFGHVVVDEAQELSPMLWRLLSRRCPTRSMTVVGDTSQTSSLGGASSWSEVFEASAPGRWRLEELTVNYRTPRQVMEFAERFLSAAGRTPPTLVSARSGPAPRIVRTAPGDLSRAAGVVLEELSALGEGRLAVVALPPVLDELAPLLPPDSSARGDAALESRMALLTPSEVKGLEFDVVVALGPSALSSGPSGVADLYVTLTRPTQRLVVVHSSELPPGLATD